MTKYTSTVSDLITDISHFCISHFCPQHFMKARSEKITSHYTATNDMTPLNRRFTHLSQNPAGNGTPSGHL